MPVCIHTICFKEWGRECAMHFRPQCVCMDCLRISFGRIARGQLVSLGWITCKWLFGLCGLRVNGYFVRVELREKI